MKRRGCSSGHVGCHCLLHPFQSSLESSCKSPQSQALEPSQSCSRFRPCPGGECVKETGRCMMLILVSIFFCSFISFSLSLLSHLPLLQLTPAAEKQQQSKNHAPKLHFCAVLPSTDPCQPLKRQNTSAGGFAVLLSKMLQLVLGIPRA